MADLIADPGGLSTLTSEQLPLGSLQAISGPKGDTGATGATGAQGTPGESAYEVAVANGFVGTEAQWLASLVGPQGIQGIQGLTGANGRGISSVLRTAGTGAQGTTDTYTITYSDATTSTFMVYNGADGLGAGDMLRSAYDTNADGKVNAADAADAVPWSGVTGKPATFAPSAHNHAISDVTGLQTALDGKQASGSYVVEGDARLTNARTPTGAAGGVLSGTYPNPGFAVDMATQAELDAVSSAKANVSHAHTIADVTGLQTALDGKQASISATGVLKAAAGVVSAATAGTDFAKPDTASSWTAEQTFKEVKDTVHTLADGNFSVDPANGSIQIVTITAARTPTAANFEAGQVVLLGIQGNFAITWTSIAPVWLRMGGSASAPTSASSGYLWVMLWKVGTTIYASEVGKV